MHYRFLTKLKGIFQLDGWLFLSMVALTLFGAAAVYSVDLSHGGDFIALKKHLLILFFGFAVFFLVSLTDYTFFRATAPWWYMAALLLLLLVLFFGDTIRGTRGWFSFGGFSLQPAEFAKLGLVLMLGFYFSRRYRYFKGSATFVGSLMLVVFMQAFILLQPDLGSAFLLGIAWFGVMLVMGTKKKYWLVFFVLLAVLGTFAWNVGLKEYQKERILIFFDPQADPLGGGYNINQSIIAVGAGQWTGRGLGFGSQSQLKFLPEAQTDFVFAVIAEELGFIGAFAVIALFALMFIRILMIVPRARDDFSSVVLVGVAVVIFGQLLVNMGGALGMLPVTGVPLPLISAGGSSLLITMTMLGIVQSIYRSVRSV